MFTSFGRLSRTDLRELGPHDPDPTEDCSMCLCELKRSASGQDAVVVVSCCGKCFHKECLTRWLVEDSSHRCPLCRHRLECNATIAVATQERVAHDGLYGLENLPTAESQSQLHGRTVSSDDFLVRATRTLEGIDPLPSFLLPDAATGESTSVEDRFRSETDGQIRNAFPEWTETMIYAYVDRQWHHRTPFMRDLEKLELLHLMLSEQEMWAAAASADDAEMREWLHEYGLLLECLAPLTRANHRRRVEVDDVIFPEMEREARLFSLMTEEEEGFHREEDLRETSQLESDEERHKIVEWRRQDRRVAFMIGQGVYHLYSDYVPQWTYRSGMAGRAGRSFSQPGPRVQGGAQFSARRYRATSLSSRESGGRGMAAGGRAYYGLQRHDRRRAFRSEQRLASNHRHPEREQSGDGDTGMEEAERWDEACVG